MGRTRILTREDILARDDRRYEVVEVPEWGGSVRIRTLSARERDEFEESILRRRGQAVEVVMRGMRVRLAALCMVDEQGNRLFSDDEVEVLADRSAAAIERVFEAAARLNRILPEDLQAALGN